MENETVLGSYTPGEGERTREPSTSYPCNGMNKSNTQGRKGRGIAVTDLEEITDLSRVVEDPG